MIKNTIKTHALFLAAKSSPITSLRPTLFVGFCVGFIQGFIPGFIQGFWGTFWGTRFTGGGVPFFRSATVFRGRGLFFQVVVRLWRSSSVF